MSLGEFTRLFSLMVSTNGFPVSMLVSLNCGSPTHSDSGVHLEIHVD